MGKCFNVVFQSTIPSQTTIGEVFFYDWGQMPEGLYKLTFTFFCGIANLTNTYPANIFCNLGQSTQMATVNAGQFRSGYLGMLLPSGTGASQFLYAETTTNPPTYMTRPTNNRVFIEIHTNQLSFEENYPVNVGEYTLCMSFELQE
jgi:hypothetical protein